MQQRLRIGAATAIREHDLFSTEIAAGSAGLLQVVTPRRPRLDAAKVIRERKDDLVGELHQHGALLFRGWDVADPDQFNAIVEAFSDNLLDYSHKSTPRTRIRGGVYTSTEYPPDQVIPLHNELSWSSTAPRYLWFCCLEPAADGGATPIADSRRVLRLLPPAVREKFARHGVMYVRNYHPNLDLPWQEVFGTDSKEAVAAYCRSQGATAVWVRADHLRTRHILHAVIRHPDTDELAWFNQAHLFHYSRVGPAGASSLLSLFDKGDLPRNTYLGNGADISDEDLAAIRAAYDQALYRFAWQAGDILLVDNLACAHGRDTYTPPRKIIVAMTDPVKCRTISSADVP